MVILILFIYLRNLYPTHEDFLEALFQETTIYKFTFE